MTEFTNEFSKEIWEQTYKDYKDNSIDDTFRRVAKALASVEKTDKLKKEWEDRFTELQQDFKVTLGGRIYSNAGTEFVGTTLINCFVGPREVNDIDSLDGIIKVLREQIHTLRSEGGWGMNFSFIRPRGSFVHGIGVETPGAVEYIQLFNTSSSVITAGSGRKSKNKKAKGKIRKGAMMGILDCVAGDSLISTIEGKIPIKDLVGKNPYVFCADTKGKMYLRQATKVWSKGVKKTVRIRFDDDSYLVCTPEHKILLSNYQYKEAKDLKFNDSVAFLSKKLYSGQYLYAGITGTRGMVADHILAYESKYHEYPTAGAKNRKPHDTIAHHIDENKLNNHPDNIQKISVREHAIHHYDDEKMSIYREKILKNRKGKTFEEFYGVDKAKKVKEKLINTKRINANHKVLSVEEYNEVEFFDIAVPDFHNFVANGVFVHNCWHPDIEEFIKAKRNAGSLSKFNVSVNCSNEFMEKLIKVNKAIEDGKDVSKLDSWDLIFPDTTFDKYKKEWDGNIKLWKEKGYPVEVIKTVKITELWNLIMDSTYNFNDPGVIFGDRANETHCWNYGTNSFIGACNPCGEQMLPYGSTCNLLSLNLTQFLNNALTDFDYEKIKRYIPWAVRLSDNVNDYSNAPLPQYIESLRKRRRIGFGIIGWASALYLLEIRFGSDKAEKLKSKVMECINHSVVEASINLAKEKGAFADCNFEKHANHSFWKQIGLPSNLVEDIRKYGIRNSALFSIQPTGNTSQLANIVSSGLEPIFLQEYIRTVIVPSCPEILLDKAPKYWEGEFKENKYFKLTKEGIDQILVYTDPDTKIKYKIDKNRGLTKEVLCEDYAVKELKKLNKWNSKADWAVTTQELSVEEHIKDITGFGKWMDSSMSKTVNLPADYPFSNFKDLYTNAFKSKVLKGVTTYRAGTTMSVLSKVEDDKERIRYNDAPKRPPELPCKVFHVTRNKQEYFILIGMLNNMAFEIFAGKNHNHVIDKKVAKGKIIKLGRGKYRAEFDDRTELSPLKAFIEPEEEIFTRMISTLLRHGVKPEYILHQLEKTAGDLQSLSKSVARALKYFVEDGIEIAGEECPDCKGRLFRSEGCRKCSQCSWTACN